MKLAIAIILASTIGFAVPAQAKNKKKRAAIEACKAEGKVNAKGRATRACIREKMKK